MKHFTLTRIRQAFPKFNLKEITEADFWRACKKFRIIVRQMPLDVDGYHERKRGRYYILINSRLQGKKWLHTALHEFCHYLFDAPDAGANFVLYRRRQKYDEHGCPVRRQEDDDPRERFADAFATVGFMPLNELIRFANEDISEDPELLKLCRARIGVLDDYGI
jgi:Zn-dependent peptidase ImmA (M78 family)